MRYYIIAGEASGDLHGAALVSSIKKQDPNAVIRAWGGELMENEGALIVKHYRDLAFMGFAEVLSNLRTILKNISWCKKDIQAFKPDAVIYIDYPGFNLRIARWASKLGNRNFYYIAPQIWAWHTSRAEIIRKHIEKVYAILPFEKVFYQENGVDVMFVGHPLKDRIGNFQKIPMAPDISGPGNTKVLALLPGSRKQEIRRLLPIMLKAARAFAVDHDIVIAMAPGQSESFYREITDPFSARYGDLKMIQHRTYELLSKADLAIVTSGTATLEAALFKVPQVVVYKGSTLSYQIAKRLVKVKYISLVNLILDKEVVPELIQEDCNPKNVSRTLSGLLEGKEGRTIMLKQYDRLWELLGPEGASDKTARDIIQRLRMEG